MSTVSLEMSLVAPLQNVPEDEKHPSVNIGHHGKGRLTVRKVCEFLADDHFPSIIRHLFLGCSLKDEWSNTGGLNPNQ